MTLRRLVLLAALAALASSCAYYNTFYLARKYYFKATNGLPYAVDKPDASAAPNFTKSIDLSKKVLANYPKSKWVDNAYLLWARGLLGRDDPRETVRMLQDFVTRYPDSKLGIEALFYLGVGQRQSHHYAEGEQTLAQFLERAPNHSLAPYAWLERARSLASLDRDSAAAFCAGQVLERFPTSRLGPQALAARAQALLDAGEYARARTDFQALGLNARDDEERLGYLLREADCVEASRDYQSVLGLLQDALAHEQMPPDLQGAVGATYVPVPGGDRYGRILMRIGTAHLLADRPKEALQDYQEIRHLYPKSPLGAEAQYRIGYAYETTGDDLERARNEYAHVKDEFANSAFTAQAQSRMANLDRVAQFRAAGGDTVAKRAEAGFLLAELHLFQNNRPERALEEYRKVAAQWPGTPWAAKALTAQAWVLRRKLGRAAEADSLLWVVVHDYPATESQLAARDYLEQAGIGVPDSLIKAPPVPVPPPVDTTRLTSPPSGPMPLRSAALRDSLGLPGSRRGLTLARPGTPAGRQHLPWDPRFAGTAGGAPAVAGDSPYGGGGWVAPADSSGQPPRPRALVPPDSTRSRLER